MTVLTEFMVISHCVVRGYDSREVERTVAEGLAKITGVKVVERVAVTRVPRLCEGSEEAAVVVNVATSDLEPYHKGQCRACGRAIPLLSAGNFEVMKHFAPTVVGA